VQDACAAALGQWPVDGVPSNPRAWLVSVARHKAFDRIRRESRRLDKEATAMRDLGPPGPPPPEDSLGDDELGLIFMCCHPALDPAVRVPLTLRSVCGLTTAEIAAAFLLPEPTMAKRLVRAKHKIRDAGIPLRVPGPEDLEDRLAAVLRVVYLVFTEGHMATGGEHLVRGDLCDTAIRLARALTELLPEESEVTALLALLLLSDARRPARTDANGDLVLLEEQDRSRWTVRSSPRANPWSPRRSGSGARVPTSCTRPSPRAIRPRRRPLPPTGARSRRCTASCSATSPRRWSKPTGRWRWPWRRDRRPGW
jgi:RNA polymerase sigma-70 factor (ECF subfamily)